MEQITTIRALPIDVYSSNLSLHLRDVLTNSDYQNGMTKGIKALKESLLVSKVFLYLHMNFKNGFIRISLLKTRAKLQMHIHVSCC